LVEVPVEGNASPTAMHEIVETHDKPNRSAPCTLDGLGEVTIFHDVPFQLSVRVESPLAPDEYPTAMHDELETHDTSDK
jgi:hypothetical protein